VEPRFAVLAVCTANICRSPFIEMVLRERLDDRHFEVASAGVRGWSDKPMDAMAAMELMRIGLTPGTFRSHPIDDYFVRSAGLILTATTDHRSEILGSSPEALRRTFTLLEFAQLVETVDGDDPATLVAEAARHRSRATGDLDVADPYRRKPAVYRSTSEQMDVACATIADRLNASVTPPGIA
jgi:protein-tyrosine phosphatase